MKLEEVGEFGLIRRFSPRFLAHLPEGVRGIGDDCAVIEFRDGNALLVTTDLLIEGTHFLLDRISARELGYKSLAVNVSDVAAMGGAPHSAYLSLGLSPRVEVEWVDEFFEGFGELADRTRTLLLGGDTARAPGGIVVNVAVLGLAPASRLKYRSSAKAGDAVFVTGELGDAAAGLRCLAEGGDRSEDAQELIRRHHLPRPHVDEGLWLGGRAEVRAMIDVSDGLDSDLSRILEASGVGAEVEIERLPTSDALRRECKRRGWEPEALAAGGGEDYCLLLTADAAASSRLASEFAEAFGRPLHRVGTIVESGLRYLREGRPVRFEPRGFQHFGG